MESLKPIRMVLVGLGIDESATRMVDFLKGRGIDIALYIFHGYRYGETTLLAKSVEQAPPETERSKGGYYVPRALRRQRLVEQAEELGIADFWAEVTEELKPAAGNTPEPLASGFNFYMPQLKMEGLSYGDTVNVSHSVVMDKDGKTRVRFFPIAIDLCFKRFEEHRKAGLIEFEHKAEPFVATTQCVSDEWHVVLDRNTWAQHRGALKALAGEVNDAWLERLRTPA